MKIHTVDTGYFKLDGGAMFGVVPRQLWERLNPPDDRNMCTWAMRCLLVEHQYRLILFDTGIGDKQDAKFRSHFSPHGEASLLGSIRQRGFTPEDITDVFLTHLHFDHVGGAVRRTRDGELVPTFPKARYWSNERHYAWALEPNAREKASFLKENFVPLQEHGVLHFIPESDQPREWLPGIQVRFLYGHTEAMMMPVFDLGDQKVYYGVDLLPSSFHIGMPYVMSYDVRPLKTLEEKATLYQELQGEPHLLVFEHDPRHECGRLTRNDRGRFSLEKAGKLADVLS